MKKFLLLLLVSGMVFSGTIYSRDPGDDYVEVSAPSMTRDVDDFILVDKEAVDASNPQGGFMDSVKGEASSAWHSSKHEAGKEIQKAKDEMRKELEGMRKQMVKQVLMMVILFLREKLPSMVMAAVKNAVASPRGAYDKVRGWFGYGKQSAPEAEPVAATADDDELLRQMLDE